MSTVAESSPLDMIQHREYTDTALPNGDQARKYILNFVQQYANTRQSPSYVLQYRVALLTMLLNSDAIAFSNPRRVIEHPAFKEIEEIGVAAIPQMLSWLRRDPYVWLMALPVLVGSSPVLPEHRGQTQSMVEDWLRWGRENGYVR